VAASANAALAEDSNDDGLADAWQLLHFGPRWEGDPDAAPAADPDDDGITNEEEEEDGTAPTNAGSRFFRVTVTAGTVGRAPHAPGLLRRQQRPRPGALGQAEVEHRPGRQRGGGDLRHLAAAGIAREDLRP